MVDTLCVSFKKFVYRLINSNFTKSVCKLYELVAEDGFEPPTYGL